MHTDDFDTPAPAKPPAKPLNIPFIQTCALVQAIGPELYLELDAICKKIRGHLPMNQKKIELFECPRMPGHLRLTKVGCIANQDKIKNYRYDGITPKPGPSYQNCVDCPKGKEVRDENPYS
jgi:hypothetical protein